MDKQIVTDFHPYGNKKVHDLFRHKPINAIYLSRTQDRSHNQQKELLKRTLDKNEITTKDCSTLPNGKICYIKEGQVIIEGIKSDSNTLGEFELTFAEGESIKLNNVKEVKISMIPADDFPCQPWPGKYLFEHKDLYDVVFYIIQVERKNNCITSSNIINIYMGPTLIDRFHIAYPFIERSKECGRFTYVSQDLTDNKLYIHWLYNYAEHLQLGKNSKTFLDGSSVTANRRGYDILPNDIIYHSGDSEVKIVFFRNRSKACEILLEFCRQNAVVNRLPNVFPDDDTENYLVCFSSNQVDDIFFVCKCLSNVILPRSDGLVESSFAGYAIYNIPIQEYYTILMGDDLLTSPFWKLTNDDYINKYNMLEDIYSQSKMSFSLKHFPRDMPFLNVTSSGMMFMLNRFLLSHMGAIEISHEGAKRKYEAIYKQLLDSKQIGSKWISEIKLYTTINKLYPDAVFQYHPKWLGRQSLDVYIPSINIGFEYQGIQHYQPIDYFGGEEAFKKRIELDEKKKRLCMENNVKLIEITYKDTISIKTIKDKMKHVAL